MAYPSYRSPKSSSQRRHTASRRTTSGAPRWGVWLAFLLVAALIILLIYCFRAEAERPAASAQLDGIEALELQKVKTPADLDQVLIPYLGFTVNFNPTTHQPNYVAWELLGSETDGETGRQSSFGADDQVAGCASPADYRASGYDRGHMAPAGDMKWDPEAMRQSFLMTNICPQAGDLNRGSWKKLEEKCRAHAVADSAIIIIAGPIFDRDPEEFIGDTRVPVPQRFFKVILSPFAPHPRAIGFIMPNGHVPGGMQPCAVSVDEVERITGMDFFAALPDELENALEAQCDFNTWSRWPSKAHSLKAR